MRSESITSHKFIMARDTPVHAAIGGLAMKTIKKGCDIICGIIDRINLYVGTVSMFLAVLFLAITVYEVIMRRFLNSPTIWGQESATMLFGSYMILTSGWALLKKQTIGVDILVNMFPKWVEKVCQAAGYLFLFFPFFVFTAMEGWRFFLKSFQYQDTSTSPWAPTLWPYKLCLFVGLALLLLQGVSEFIKIFYQKNKTQEEAIGEIEGTKDLAGGKTV